MYCNNCGSEIADGAKFCSNCGTPVTMQTRPAPEPEVLQKTPAEEPDTVSDRPAERPSFAEFQWNVEDYPTRNSYEKTDDVDFNWNADPADIQDVVYRPAVTPSEPAAVQYTDGMESTAESAAGNNDLHNSVSDQSDRQADPESMSAADRIDKFYTFNRKNEEFQQLLNREYEKIKSGNAIEHEMSEASKNADEIFESRPVDSSMEAFLEREGIVKPYQPKAFESDVLQRIEAQEAEKEAKSLIPLNKDYEQKIFNRRNVDWDCYSIWQLMLEENKNIEKLLAVGEYQAAALMFLQLTKSMCRHFVIDRHWEYFDDMYSPEYAIRDLTDEFEKLAKEGKLPKDVNAYLHEAWKEIEGMESCTDYGVPRGALPF